MSKSMVKKSKEMLSSLLSLKIPIFGNLKTMVKLIFFYDLIGLTPQRPFNKKNASCNLQTTTMMVGHQDFKTFQNRMN